MINIEDRKMLVSTALGREPLDLVIDDVKIVDVYTGFIRDGALGIKNDYIVTLEPKGLDTKEVKEGKGQFAFPGFIDSHVHLDSSLVTPENLAELIVPRGTTVMLADPMESANVGGIAGLKALLSGSDTLPYHLFLEVSSRVPTAPGLETTGGTLDLEQVREIIKWDSSISLGELDPSKILGFRDEYYKKVEVAHRLGKIANGHAAGIHGRELEAYVCGGLSDDHECVNYEEALERLRVGLPIFIREGSTERNLEPIITGVVNQDIDTRHLMFCTDDKHPDDLLAEGHIDFMVNRSISLGVPPIKAIQMATINAAVHFRVDGYLGSLSPGRWADIILAPEIENIVPNEVYHRGELVAEKGKLIDEPPAVNYPSWFSDTVKISSGNVPGDFKLASSGNKSKLRVIELYPDQIINRFGQAELPVSMGNVLSDVDQDVLKIAVVERYGKNGNIGISFVKGFGLKRGALASSVAHDHHNIIVAGTNENDMALCVRAIDEMRGGLVLAAEGKVMDRITLAFGGLINRRYSR